MGDIKRLVENFDGQQVGGVVIVFEDGKHKEAARNVDGTWVIDAEFRERMAAQTPTGEAEEKPTKRRGRKPTVGEDTNGTTAE